MKNTKNIRFHNFLQCIFKNSAKKVKNTKNVFVKMGKHLNFRSETLTVERHDEKRSQKQNELLKNTDHGGKKVTTAQK